MHIIYYQILNLGQSSAKDNIIRILLNVLRFYRIFLKIILPCISQKYDPKQLKNLIKPKSCMFSWIANPSPDNFTQMLFVMFVTFESLAMTLYHNDSNKNIDYRSQRLGIEAK